MLTSEYLEGRLIGSAMRFPDILLLISPADFRQEQSQLIWRAMRECRSKYQHLDFNSFRDHMKAETGQDLTQTLQSYEEMAAVTPQLAEQSCQMLINENRRIRLDEGIERLNSLDAPVDAKVNSLRKLLEVAAPRVVRIPKTMKDHTRVVVENMESLFQGGEIPGIQTGLPMFDQILGGLQGQDLYIIAARPSMGKTALGVNWALHSTYCAIVSAEQSAMQLTQRMIAIIGSVPAHKLRNPRKLEDDEWLRVTEAARLVSEYPIQILDDPSPTVESAVAWISQAVTLGAKWALVDYLQRLKAEDKRMGTYERISHIAASLKECARNLNIPVVALAQINRQGADKPRMEHLKGSGDIEQEADVIGILERDLENDPTSGSLNLEKNRHGPLVDIPINFHTSTMRFVEAYRGQ